LCEASIPDGETVRRLDTVGGDTGRGFCLKQLALVVFSVPSVQGWYRLTPLDHTSGLNKVQP